MIFGLHFYRLNQFVSPKSDFYQLLFQDAFADRFNGMFLY